MNNNRKTRFKDDDGRQVHEGDVLRSSYGIPGRRIEGPVVFEAGEFYVITEGHTPPKSTLADFVKHLGNFWIVPPNPSPTASSIGTSAGGEGER